MVYDSGFMDDLIPLKYNLHEGHKGEMNYRSVQGDGDSDIKDWYWSNVCNLYG